MPMMKKQCGDGSDRSVLAPSIWWPPLSEPRPRTPCQEVAHSQDRLRCDLLVGSIHNCHGVVSPQGPVRSDGANSLLSDDPHDLVGLDRGILCRFLLNLPSTTSSMGAPPKFRSSGAPEIICHPRAFFKLSRRNALDGNPSPPSYSVKKGAAFRCTPSILRCIGSDLDRPGLQDRLWVMNPDRSSIAFTHLADRLG